MTDLNTADSTVDESEFDSIVESNCDILPISPDEQTFIQLIKQIDQIPLTHIPDLHFTTTLTTTTTHDTIDPSIQSFTDSYSYPFRVTFDPISNQLTRILDLNQTNSLTFTDEFWLNLHPEEIERRAKLEKEEKIMEEVKARSREQAEEKLIQKEKEATGKLEEQSTYSNISTSFSSPGTIKDSWAFMQKKRTAPSQSNSNGSDPLAGIFTRTKRMQLSYPSSSDSMDPKPRLTPHQLTLKYALQINLHQNFISDSTDATNSYFNRPVLVLPTIPPTQPYLLKEWPPFIKRRSFAYKVFRRSTSISVVTTAITAVSSTIPYPAHIVYFMDSCARIEDNLTLQLCIWLSSKLRLPLLVMSYLTATSTARRKILSLLQKKLRILNIPTLCVELPPTIDDSSSYSASKTTSLPATPSSSSPYLPLVHFLSTWCNLQSTHMLFSDDCTASPLRSIKPLLANKINCSFYCIENDNLCSVRYVPSDISTFAHCKYYLESLLYRGIESTSNSSSQINSNDSSSSALTFTLPFPEFSVTTHHPSAELQFSLYTLTQSAQSTISEFLKASIKKNAVVDVDVFNSDWRTLCQEANDNGEVKVPNQLKEYSVVDWNEEVSSEEMNKQGSILNELMLSIDDEPSHPELLNSSSSSSSFLNSIIQQASINSLHPVPSSSATSHSISLLSHCLNSLWSSPQFLTLLELTTNSDPNFNCVLYSPLRLLYKVFHTMNETLTNQQSWCAGIDENPVWKALLEVVLFSREWILLQHYRLLKSSSSTSCDSANSSISSCSISSLKQLSLFQYADDGSGPPPLEPHQAEC